MLRCFVSYQQDKWEDYLSLLEFAYNNSVSVVTGQTPFYLNYRFHPRTPTTAVESPTSVVELDEWLVEMDNARTCALDCIRDAQEVAQFYANQGRRDLSFREGERVYLSTKNLAIKNLPKNSANSLKPRRIGPYKITRVISPVAYELELPESMKIHPIFHVSLLSPYYDSQEHFPDRMVPDRPPSIEIGGEQEFEVEEIIGDRVYRNRYPEFLVKWKGYPIYEATWEQAEALQNAPEILEAYKAKQALLQVATALATQKNTPPVSRGRTTRSQTRTSTGTASQPSESESSSQPAVQDRPNRRKR
jgi:hypothetical protein